MTEYKRKVNILYFALQMLYWSSIAAIMGYSLVFLKTVGCSNSQCGIILAMGDATGLILTLYVAPQIDLKGETFMGLASIVCGIMQLLLLVMISAVRNLIIVSIDYIVVIALGAIMNVFTVRYFSILQQSGSQMKFGIPRGAGSVMYGITAFCLGLLLKYCDEIIILSFAEVVIFLEITVLVFLHKVISSNKECAGDMVEDRETHRTFKALIKFCPRFFIFVIGLTLIMAAYSTENAYLPLIVQNVGGNSADLGKLMSFLAIIEMPVMLVYSQIRKRKVSVFLILAIIVFPARAFVIYASRSISELFLSIPLQTVSFGLYVAVIVDYISKVLPEGDSSKAFSMTAIASTVGSFISTGVSGFLIDAFSIEKVLLVLALVSVLGSVVCIAGIKKDV